MFSPTVSSLLFVSGIYAAAIVPRATDLTCTDLRVKSNDGDRKVAIVIDSSGSMTSSDPFDLRLAAGRALNDWLISSKEASGGKKSDLVTVIDFDDEPHLDYPLGDPGSAANGSFSLIDSFGGTYIAGGVEMAISQLISGGSGSTADRSGIVVFTDGEDFSTTLLVEQINNATSLGIRVNFGFLDSSASYQDKEVLVAIGKSGGVYSTITTEDSSNNFINYAILNGLTKNDNPSGDNSTLLAGLATAHFTGGSQTQSVTYNARSNEHIDFTIQTIDAGPLTAELFFGGKSKNKTDISTFSDGFLSYTAGSAGQIEIKVSATDAPPDSLFVVGATSDMPSQNCTVGVGSGGGGGLNTGAKVGLGIGIPVMVGLLGLLGYFMWKHWGKFPKLSNIKFLGPDLQSGKYGAQAASWDPQPPVNGAEKFLDPGKPGPDAHHSVHSVVSSLSNTMPLVVPPVVPPASNPANNRYKLRIQKRNADQEYHHHHLHQGHPCWAPSCSQSLPYHQCQDHRCLCPDPQRPLENHKCEDIKFQCACTNQECPLNNSQHECVDPEHPCACSDATCPLSEEQKKKRQNDIASRTGLKIVSTAGTHVMNAM